MMRIARNKTLLKKNFHSIHVKETRLNNTFIWSKDLIIVPSHQMTPPGRVGFLFGSRESPRSFKEFPAWPNGLWHASFPH